ncbi:ricin B lectin domain-containing protein [Astrocystis sublimbata]|nr:ricin B lectin domain-containing protein [Astrocystis sublimbata]
MDTDPFRMINESIHLAIGIDNTAGVMDNRQDYFIPDRWHGKTVKFISVRSNTALDLNAGKRDNGTTIQGWEQNGSEPQQWYLEKVTPGAAWSPWKIRNVSSGTYMDLYCGRSENGTAITGWDNGGNSTNAHWYIISQEQSDDAVVLIQSAVAFTYVDLDGARPGNGTKVHAWQRGEGQGNPNHFWKMSAV